MGRHLAFPLVKGKGTFLFLYCPLAKAKGVPCYFFIVFQIYTVFPARLCIPGSEVRDNSVKLGLI